MDDTVEAMDRISELPHFIIHQIMSHLKTKEVARTSILSKTWYQLRNSFPILVFNQNYFFPGDEIDFRGVFLEETDEKFCETVKKFLEFVDSSLLRFCEFKLCMQSLIITLTLLDVKGSAPMVDKWIGLAVENGVKVLKFNNATNESTLLLYTLPQTIFNANLVTTLELSWCRLEQPPSETLIRLHSLKRLMLRRVCLDERMIQKITSECPVLEDLSFSDCWGFKRLCVSKAFKLKILKIQSWSEEVEILEISIPCLEQLILRFNVKRRPRIVVEVARSPHLKKLDLTDVSFASEEFNNLISNFPMLENLWVFRCCMPGRIKISSNQLKKLRLSHCEDLTAIDVDTPNLLSLTYAFKSIPTTSINNVPCPWKISFSCRGGFDTHWYLELKKFLGASTQIEKLRLSLISGKVVSNLDDLGGSSPSLALQVGNLELSANVLQLDSENLLDGVFWICYPRTLKVTVSYDEEYKFLERISDQLRNRRDVNCCNSVHIKCWRHYLKDIIRTQNCNHPTSSIFYLDWCVPVPNEKS